MTNADVLAGDVLHPLPNDSAGTVRKIARGLAKTATRQSFYRSTMIQCWARRPYIKASRVGRVPGRGRVGSDA
jgi:hypothetical protein